jgi:hypothetical protein
LGLRLRKWKNYRVRLMNSGLSTMRTLKSKNDNLSILLQMASRFKSKANLSEPMMISINKE